MDYKAERFGWITTAEGERYEMNTENTIVFQHLGEKAVYDHLFVVTQGETAGLHIWNYDKNYQSLVESAIRLNATIFKNIRKVNPKDIEAYENTALRDIRNTNEIPADWLK